MASVPAPMIPRASNGARGHLYLIEKHVTESSSDQGGDGSRDHPDRHRLARHDPRRCLHGLVDQGGGDRLDRRGLRDGRQHSRGSQAPADQPRPESVTGPRQPAANRADRPSQPFGGLLMGEPFQMAEDDRRPVFLRQPAHLLFQHLPEVQRLLDGGGPAVGRPSRHLRAASLVPAPTGRGGPRIGRDPQGDPVQPTGHRVAIADRAGPLDQDQERRLEGILRVVEVTQGAPADAHHHRTVPFDQGIERRPGRLATPGREPLQELAVGEVADGPHLEQPQEMARSRLISPQDHGPTPPNGLRGPR